MKKLISIILIVILSLSAFSCVSCFADADSNCLGEECTNTQKSIYSDEVLLNELGWIARHLDTSCGTKFENDAEYVKRIASSEDTKNCIINVLNYEKDFIEPYNKTEVRDYLNERLTDDFDFYRSNCIERNIKEHKVYSLFGETLAKFFASRQTCPENLFKVFPNRVVEVFNEKYGLN